MHTPKCSYFLAPAVGRFRRRGNDHPQRLAEGPTFQDGLSGEVRDVYDPADGKRGI